MLAQPSVDVNPVARLTEAVESILQRLLTQLPLMVLGLLVLLASILVARLVRRLVRRALLRNTDRSESFANVLANIARAATVVAGALVALSIAVPSVDAGSLVAGLGVGTIAIGFAFQDILQNTLAGLLILFRRPFRQGDQIIVGDHGGTVEEITIRETRLKTFDGRRVLIPNKDVYATAITVQTAFPAVRTSVIVGVDYGADLARARTVALDAVRGVEGVVDDPAPEAYYVELGASTIDLDLRYWTTPRQAEIRRVQDAVVAAVADALNAAGIAMPSPIVEIVARPSLLAALRGNASE